ncbi:MAG: serine protease-like protein [Archaeoglobaceae archaeon]|nr:serine protease-like protein [Archaeoglobaceae archaeon]MCX8151657.1 serine protease-like protein [Archaeoglobaceae archaeon]MDW8013065.1 S16 family serine protease [Archaeoglobaceae archaeon]
MCKKLTLILLLLLINSALALEGNSVTVKAVAVTSDGSKGVTIDITVTVSKGTGKVFVATGPMTEIDMQGSARLAAVTACDLLGIDFMDYNFFYEIQADAPIVGGPSAGAVMTVATIAALKNLTLRNDVFMTGTIYPDGFVGPVGGLKQKLEAAAYSGGKIFLIPEGQRISYVEETVVRRVGIVNVISKVYKQVDLVEFGKQIGVEVYEVYTINDALKFYSGFEIRQKEVYLTTYDYSEILKKLAEEMRKRTENIKSPQALNLIKQAEEDYLKGNYYTATSKYFQALVQARYQEYLEKILNAQQFDREVELIREEINSLKEYLKAAKLGINSLQIIAAAEERIGEAELLLYKAQNARNDNEALYNLAFAKERVESAKVWLSLLNVLKGDYEINKDELRKRAEFYITQAASMIVYAQSLGGSGNFLSMAVDSFRVARNLFSEGMYAGAAFSAIDSIVSSSLSIERDIYEKMNFTRERAKSAIGEAESVITPILPAAYFEYAENLENIYIKFMYYKMSERLAKLLTVMTKGHGEAEIVQATYVPKQQTKVDQIKKEIKEIPGFEIFLALTVLFLAYKRFKKT